MTVTIWHNPRCSKSRAALKILQEAGVEPVIRRYLDTPPSAQELSAVLAMLERPARDLLRKGEPEYKELGLEDVSNEGVLIAAMATNPRLIERPVVVAGERAVIGRPPEAVRDIL